MHIPKFKIGDVVHNDDYGDYIIKKSEGKGYEVTNKSNNNNGFIGYHHESLWCLATSNNKHCDVSKPSNVGLCPRCGGELKDHMSIGLGEMIKKCSNRDCGWC